MEVLLQLPIESIFKMCQVNRSIQLICQSNYFWQQLMDRDYPGLSEYCLDGESAQLQYQALYEGHSLDTTRLDVVINLLQQDTRATGVQIAKIFQPKKYTIAKFLIDNYKHLIIQTDPTTLSTIYLLAIAYGWLDILELLGPFPYYRLRSFSFMLRTMRDVAETHNHPQIKAWIDQVHL